MSRHTDEVQFIDESVTVSVEQMLELSGLSLDELNELVQHGAFGHELASMVVEQWRFAGRSVRMVRRVSSLRVAFELDAGSTSLVMGLLERIDELERRARELECGLVGRE